jgi:hypothetical protein
MFIEPAGFIFVLRLFVWLLCKVKFTFRYDNDQSQRRTLINRALVVLVLGWVLVSGHVLVNVIGRESTNLFLRLLAMLHHAVPSTGNTYGSQNSSSDLKR